MSLLKRNLLSIDSLLPLLNFLPGLVLKNSVYVGLTFVYIGWQMDDIIVYLITAH